MGKRKKRRLEEVEERNLIIPDPLYDLSFFTDNNQSENPPESRLEVKFFESRIRDVETANKTESSLVKLLERICSIYTERYDCYSQSLVNHHLTMFGMLGLPFKLSLKSLYYKYTHAAGAHSSATRFLRANRNENQIRHFPELLRLFAWAERESNTFLYSRFGPAVATFYIKRNIILLFRQIITLNELIGERRWRELGICLNSAPFLHYPLLAWLYYSRTKSRDTYMEKRYQSLRHDVFVSALYVWHAAALRILHAEESREWKSSRLVLILRRAISQCRMTGGVSVPQHVLLTDAVSILISLEESFMLHHFHAIDLELTGVEESFRRPYESFKLLAQARAWEEEQRVISGVTDRGTVLIDELLDASEREGSAGVIFALAALRCFMKIAETVEDHSSLHRLLSYSISTPRAVRPLAGQMRACGMGEQAGELVEKAITASSPIHGSDPIWLDWAEGRMREEEEGKGEEKKYIEIAEVLLRFLDYGSNRGEERAWRMLEGAMERCPPSLFPLWWEDRKEWWPTLHGEEMEKRGKKARKRVMRRLRGKE